MKELKALIKPLILKANLSKSLESQQSKMYHKMNDMLNILRTRQANYIFGTEEEEHQTRQAVIHGLRKLASAIKSYKPKKTLMKTKTRKAGVPAPPVEIPSPIVLKNKSKRKNVKKNGYW